MLHVFLYYEIRRQRETIRVSKHYCVIWEYTEDDVLVRSLMHYGKILKVGKKNCEYTQKTMTLTFTSLLTMLYAHLQIR